MFVTVPSHVDISPQLTVLELLLADDVCGNLEWLLPVRSVVLIGVVEVDDVTLEKGHLPE